MRALVGASRLDPAVISIVGLLGLLSLGVLSGQGVMVLALLLAFATILALLRHSVIEWDRMIALILIIVLFVPISRYRLPGNLPFQFELYRVVAAVCLLLWLASLLIDSRVRIAGTALDPPLLLIVACVLGSEITNPSRVAAYGSNVVKTLTFFASFVLIYYLTATTLRGRESVRVLLKLLTVSGAIVGVCAAYEQRTHYNVFNHLHTVLPFLSYEGDLSYLLLGGNLRAFGSAQQPIALGAALILILPFAVYFARTRGRRWWIAASLLILGALASGSRTAIVMLAAEAIVFLCLKPVETKKLWPVLVPALAIVHFALPGTIGSFKNAFFPKGGIIAQQSRFEPDYNPLLAGGRVRLLRPMLSEASGKPLFGEGYGTRIQGFNTPNRNAPILDDQWLNNVLDVGFIGLAAWAWLIVRAVRRLSRASRTEGEEGDDDDWLFAAFAASFTGFGIGMFTFDAFAFTQVTILFWILLGLGAGMLRLTAAEQHPRAPAYRFDFARRSS